MYDLHPRKKSILLWCFKKTSSDSASRKRPRSSSSSQASNAQKISQSSTNYESHQRGKVAETNETLAKLELKHGDKYSSEQLHTWANLIQLKRHSSLDTPPDYPFFRGRKKSKTPSHLQNLRDPLHQKEVTQAVLFPVYLPESGWA